MSTQPLERLTPERYLELERAAEQKHEFVDGVMVAMAGGSPRHAFISNRCSYLLTAALQDRCGVFSPDLRVSIHWERLIAYPDVTVLCGEAEYADGRRDTITNPTLVVEVLSPSTKVFDQSYKTRMCWSVPSMREFLLVDQTPVEIEHHRRLPDGSWQIQRYRDRSAVVTLESLGCSLPVEAIYRNAEQY